MPSDGMCSVARVCACPAVPVASTAGADAPAVGAGVAPCGTPVEPSSELGSVFKFKRGSILGQSASILTLREPL